jgi:hypothetical protein
MDDARTERRPPQAWADALQRARADVAAGRTSEADKVIGELEAEDPAELEAETGAAAMQRPASSSG